MDVWKFIDQHGFVLVFATTALLGMGWLSRRMVALAETFFKSDGVVAGWFVENQKSQAVIADAVKAMPVAISSINAAAAEHHKQVQIALDKLVEQNTHLVNQSAEVCTFHAEASSDTSVFSTVQTNAALRSSIRAAIGFLDKRDPIHCKAELERALDALTKT